MEACYELTFRISVVVKLQFPEALRQSIAFKYVLCMIMVDVKSVFPVCSPNLMHFAFQASTILQDIYNGSRRVL